MWPNNGGGISPDAIPKSIHLVLPRSNMCKSLRHPIFSPIPPKIISRSSLVLGFPFRISVQVCRYLGDGPVPTQVKVFHSVFPPVKMIDIIIILLMKNIAEM